MASLLPTTLEIVTAPNQVNELTKDAIDYIDTISDPILFDEMLREKDKRDRQAKCSEIFGFTIRKLTPDECVKFKLDSSKNYQIIISIETESVASISGLKIGDILIGIYNTNGQIRQLFDFVDEDALYNIYGNKLFDNRTIIYISFRVLRYVYKNAFDFNLDYVDVLVIDLKTLQHTLRFALPYTNGDLNDTIINFGSAYFEKYIDGLTDNRQQMVGGGGDGKGKGSAATGASAAAATGASAAAASAAIPSRKTSQGQGGVVVGKRPNAMLTDVQNTMDEIRRLKELEPELPPGPQKTAMQKQIAEVEKIRQQFLIQRQRQQEKFAEEKAIMAEKRRIQALPPKQRREALALAAQLAAQKQELAAQQQELNKQIKQQQVFTASLNTGLSSVLAARRPEISPEELERENNIPLEKI